MAFKIVKSETIKWPITVEFPVDGGRFMKETFEGEFKRLKQERIKEISKQIDEGSITDADLCKEVLVGWSGITDDGGEVSFTDSNRDKLLDVPLVAKAVVFAFIETITGARRKN